MRRQIRSIRVGVKLLSLVFVTFGAAVAAVESSDPPSDSATTQTALDAKVAQLIEQLGAPKYATREKAQSDLEQLGLAAFDALFEAQEYDNIEIALRAKYLVRSLQVGWSHEADAPEVKRILKNYGTQNEQERKSRMQRLTKLDDGQGVDALCRLVRFETSEILSKHAALLIMGPMQPEDEAHRRRSADSISLTVGQSKRTAAKWLRAYVRTLRDRESSLQEWEQLASDEYQAFGEDPDVSTNQEITRELLRWQTELLRELGRDDEAMVVIRRTLELIEGNLPDLLDMVDWLLERELWELVHEVAQRHEEEFNKHALLIYRVAEAQLRQGNEKLAEQTADRALQTNVDQPKDHNETANELQGRGFFDWAEREYRHVQKIVPPGSVYDILSRLVLSEMLHDIEKNESAAETLQVLVDLMDKNPAVEELVDKQFRTTPANVRARTHYFFSRLLAERGEREKQIERLKQAVAASPIEADVLIAMYRINVDDETWRKDVVTKIQAAANHFRQEIAANKQQLVQVQQIRQETLIEQFKGRLASANNQLAWLVGNTEGDYDEALKCSLESLELRPDAAGYLDTLGRCYFAKGDLENAVKHQSRAAELEPYSGQIQRQLDFFKSELKKKNS